MIGEKQFGEKGPPEFGYKPIVLRQFGATVRGRGEVFLPRFGEVQAFRGSYGLSVWEFTGRKPPTFSQLAAPATKDHHSPLVCSMVYYGRIS